MRATYHNVRADVGAALHAVLFASVDRLVIRGSLHPHGLPGPQLNAGWSLRLLWAWLARSDGGQDHPWVVLLALKASWNFSVRLNAAEPTLWTEDNWVCIFSGWLWWKVLGFIPRRIAGVIIGNRRCKCVTGCGWECIADWQRFWTRLKNLVFRLTPRNDRNGPGTILASVFRSDIIDTTRSCLWLDAKIPAASISHSTVSRGPFTQPLFTVTSLGGLLWLTFRGLLPLPWCPPLRRLRWLSSRRAASDDGGSFTRWAFTARGGLSSSYCLQLFGEEAVAWSSGGCDARAVGHQAVAATLHLYHREERRCWVKVYMPERWYLPTKQHLYSRVEWK